MMMVVVVLWRILAAYLLVSTASTVYKRLNLLLSWSYDIVS